MGAHQTKVAQPQYAPVHMHAPLHANHHTVPVPSTTKEQLPETNSLKSLLVKCGEVIAIRAGAKEDVQPPRPPKFPGYTESPWYETPYYRKLRAGKPIPPTPPPSDRESTDEDLMNFLMGNDSTGPPTPNTSSLDSLCDKIPPVSESTPNSKDTIDEVKFDSKGNAELIRKEGEENRLNIYNLESLCKDDTDEEVRNMWAENFDDEMKPGSGPEGEVDTETCQVTSKLGSEVNI